MKITDEAVQAAIQGIQNITLANPDIISDEDLAIAALTAALPHLTAPCSVEVKKLEWDGDDFKSTFSNEFIGYEIQKCEDDTDDTGEHYAMNVRHYGSTYTRIGTLEEAKAEAQADFERRILSAIITKPVDVAAVREQCAIIAEGFRDKHWIAHDIKTGIFPNRSEAGVAIAAAIRALSPAEPAQVTQWQDISTAPKDLECLLLACFHKGSLEAVYIGGYSHSNSDNEGSCWWSDQDDDEIDPTHWMPLPAAPTSKGGE